MSNINDTYFDGYYKEIWKNLIPELLTVKEVDFIISFFNLQPGNHVLDLMCGYGRHALALGRKGIAVTAIDNLPDYIDEIRTALKEEKLPVEPVLRSVTDFQPGKQYDLAICMGNSLNFFDAKDVLSILSAVSSSLRTGGHLLINTWSLAEIVFKNFKEEHSGNIGGMEFSNQARIVFQPTRMEVDSSIVNPVGKTEIKKGIDYIYSINEMDHMLQQAGLSLQEVYSIPGKKKFSIGEPRAYLVAVKN